MNNNPTPEQVNESAKQLAAAILAMAAVPVGIKQINKAILASQEPIENKISAIEIAKNNSKDFKFDSEMDKILKNVEQPQIIKRVAEPVVKEPTVEEYSKYIMPSEIFGNGIDDPRNERLFKPYRDDVGLWTVGIGHLIGTGKDSDKNAFVKKYGPKLTKQQVVSIFNDEVKLHINLTKKVFGNQWNKLSPMLKMALVDISFRGDLLNPKSKNDFDFVKNIKQGNYKTAAKLYLDHKEYKKRMLNNPKGDGVVKRMNRNAEVMMKEKPMPVMVKADPNYENQS